MNTHKERKINFFSPKSGGSVNIESIPNTVLLLDGNNAIDIGSRCFTNREHLSRTRQSRFQKVCLDSLCSERVLLFHTAVASITEDIKKAESSEKTIFRKIQYLTKYIDWCDKKGLPCPLKAEGREDTFKLYSQHLENQVSIGRLSKNTAAMYQSTVETTIIEYLELPSVSRKTKRIRKSFHASSPTLPPEEKDTAKYLAVSESIFDQISDFVLGNQEFPFKFNIPEAIKAPRRHIWLFPTRSIIYDINEPEKYLPRCADYINGRVKDYHKIESDYCSKSEALLAATRLHKKIKEANSTDSNIWRMRLAAIARHAFIVMFLANTGCTWAELVTAECAESFEDSFTLNSEFQGFRLMKNRAWAETAYAVEPWFLKKLKKYFEIRKILLGDHSSNLLFATKSITNADLINEPGGQVLIRYHKQLQLLDRSITLISSRQLRKYKLNFIGKTQGYESAPLVAQNQKNTFRKHYIVGAIADCINEIGDFFDELHKVPTRTYIASCKSVDSPTPSKTEATAATFEPNCEIAASCLFCDNFLLHADEEDIKKLLSFRFFIQQIDFLSDTLDFYKSLYEPILERIDNIIDEISEVSDKTNELVREVEQAIKVDGSIDSYWQSKLNQIIDIYGG